MKTESKSERVPDELDAIQAAIDELARSRAPIQAAHKRDAALHAARVKLADMQAIANAEDKLGPRGSAFEAVETPDGVLIFKPATEPRFRTWQDIDKPTTADVSDLISACRFSPDSDQFDTLLRRFPGVSIACVAAVQSLAGFRRDKLAGN